MTERKYLIIGGVAGGMSAAARLRRLDESASIIVFERGAYVSFANCGLPYFVSGEIEDESDLLLQTPASLAAALNLDVRIGHDVTGLDAVAHTVTVSTPGGTQTWPYDALILSPGALPARPPIPGLDHPLVQTLRTVDDAKRVHTLAGGAAHAVVLGAGFIGIEAAEALNHRGVKVTVVEFAPHVLPPREKELAWLAAEEMRRLGMDVRESVAATGVTDAAGRARVALSDGTFVDADTVILSVGGTPDTAVFTAAGVASERGFLVVDAQGRTNLPDVYAVGDATLSVDGVTGKRRPVQLAGPANRAGRLVADRLGQPGAARPVPRPLGSAIVRLGALTVAMTGANRAALDEAGYTYTTLHTHPGSHAGYFPGSKQMHLMVHLDLATGAILGAQGVGEDGVDKRIDVLATAMRAGLKAPDLIDLDLCYAPPYGSAKDPVTMIGFLAHNILTGVTREWHPEQLDWARTEACLLDVRSAEEFATGHLPEAVNIPHTELRARLDEVRALAGDRPIAVTCQSGVRSYLAHRILTAAGFDSATLSGGMLTLRAWLGADAAQTLV
ncbi:MAG: FAD-dependent oxidoreductase [Propionibacteriaceae bacterium]|jgi:NADPH-dependent 2,4-dienoyl-CoA reductase/sulfur reductase-like enzyme/rhodanese-related sulfurtransferase|nr:FAD-dependent oxidoreductase [Propionibacteriaceae bacterium]